ncbi:MAG: hypothetical protein J7M39_07940 [Anaerolineae bacterium]|nr:hypothetical protein [Anaerolineae bacterium]
MISSVFWSLLPLVAILVIWWASHVDWSARVGLCRAALDQGRHVMALLVATAALLALQNVALRVVARGGSVISVATGWLSAAILLVLAAHWHRN